MTTADKPKNQNPKGLPDLGQISKGHAKPEIPVIYFPVIEEAENKQRIRITYYGNKGQEQPDTKAQISISLNQWGVCLYMKPYELRELAAQLCQAAAAIEDGERVFNESAYQRNLEGV